MKLIIYRILSVLLVVDLVAIVYFLNNDKHAKNISGTSNHSSNLDHTSSNDQVQVWVQTWTMVASNMDTST